MIFDVALEQAPPDPGDLLVPGWPTGRAWYRVTAVRPVESRRWANRWDLTVERVPAGSHPALGGRAHRYERGSMGA